MTRKRDSDKETLDLDVSFIEMIVITLMFVINIAMWDQLCYWLGEHEMQNGYRWVKYNRAC